jgi:integral membrane protein
MAPGAGQRPYSLPMTSKFRTVALVEAVTYLILLALVVVKRVIHGPDLVPIMGPIHGVAFLAYFFLTLAVREEQGWTGKQTILVLVASALPFGAFVVNQRMVHDPAPTPTR